MSHTPKQQRKHITGIIGIINLVLKINDVILDTHICWIDWCVFSPTRINKLILDTRNPLPSLLKNTREETQHLVNDRH